MGGLQAHVDRLNSPHAEQDMGFGRRHVQWRMRNLREVKLWPISRLAMNAVDLASLLCSRLCHDLMSPVGALNNGIELLADETDPEMREKCLELLADSARASANKLKFFRLAFGAAGGFGEEIDTPRGARSRSKGCSGRSGGSNSAGWSSADKLPKGAAKLLLNLALLAGDALVRGGRLDVGAERRDGEIELAVRAEGPRILLDPALRETLATGGSGGAVEPRAAGAWLAHSLAARRAARSSCRTPSSAVLLIGADASGRWLSDGWRPSAAMLNGLFAAGLQAGRSAT